LISFAHTLDLPLWVTVVLVLVYEILACFVSFLTQIWEKLKQPWIEAIANRIDQGTRSILSHYHHHYCRYFTYEHRDLDMKGITTQGVYTLDLEDVFIELRVDPKAPHAASVDPLRMSTNLSLVPAELRNSSHTIWEYLATPHLRNQHFVVLGPPGSGKTTLLKHLGLVLVHRKQPHVAQHFRRKLPVLLFLREHSKAIADKAEGYTLADAIRESANRWKYPMPIEWIEHRLVRGQCLILLDGLDEVADATQRQQMVTWVERQMKNYGNNRFVLTSRPFGYRENPLASVTILEVQPLTFQQATQFIMNWYRANEIKSAVRNDPGVHMKAEQGARDLVRRLRETPDLFDLAVNPLLLTMIATVHRYRGMLPGARVELYKEICEVFLGKRQAARQVAQEMRAEQRQLVLQPLAYEMMRQGVRAIDSRQAEQLIADALQQVSTMLAPHDFLESIQNTTGLLLEREHGIYSFAHKTFQEYLAAVHISKHGLLQILTAHVQEEWWHETIRLYCAQADATPLIIACARISSTEALILALECEHEALSLQSVAQQQLENMITQGIEGAGDGRRRITAEALLARRLRQMYALNEQTFIDTTLVTHAEYQLFLDEQRSQSRYYQPDHWAGFAFPAGQGRQPALGMRRSDAQAFCVWLSERAGGIWRYRLPNEEDLAQADQGIWRDLSEDTGYWTEGERRFVWSQGHPSHSLSTRIQATLTSNFASDSDLARDLALYLALTHDLAPDLARDRNSVLDLDLAFDLVRALDRDRDLARDLAFDRNLARDRNLAFARNLAFDRRLALDRNLHFARNHVRDRDRDLALSLFTHLFLLQERRAQRLSAWEGILLVKERVLVSDSAGVGTFLFERSISRATDEHKEMRRT
jgi:energy-coupling factor transporter ATP-binding protein EcfA2